MVDLKQERREWIRTHEEKYKVHELVKFPLCFDLYEEAKNAYIYGLPYATILTIVAAWNALLIQKLAIKPGENGRMPATKNMLKQARKEGVLTENLEKKIKEYHRKIRDQIVHPKSMLADSFLGWDWDEKDNVYFIEGPSEKVSSDLIKSIRVPKEKIFEFAKQGFITLFPA